MYGLVSVWAGRSVRICALVGALASPRRPVRRALLHHQDRRGPALTDHFGLPEVVGVDGIEPTHEAALRIALLRLVVQHHDDLAGDVDAREVVVLILGRGDAIAGEHQRRVHRDVGAALAAHREVGAKRVIAVRCPAAGWAERRAPAGTMCSRSMCASTIGKFWK